jgi:hypothetical protein
MIAVVDEWAQYKDEILAKLDFAKVYVDIKQIRSSGPGKISGLCPFHEDHKPSFGVDLTTGAWECFAGCGKGDVFKYLMQRTGRGFKEVLVDLGDEHGLARPGNGGDGSTAVYSYQDENGAELFQVVRGPNKTFWQQRPNGHGGYIKNLNGVRRVLYRLPELLARPGETIFIVEGEKDVDRLHNEGVLATTNSNGAGNWRNEYNAFLTDRDVVIVPDNDAPGRAHASQIARALRGLATSIRVIELPGLPEKGDVSDWLDADHTVTELLELVGATQPWSPSDEDTVRHPGGAPPDTGHGGALADRVFAAGRAAGVTLFHDEDRRPYAAIPTERGQRIVAVRSTDFEHWFMHLAWHGLGKSLSRDARNTARELFSCHAIYDGDQIPLATRVARVDRTVWIDLDGYRAVRVVPGSWEIVARPPILFRTYPHQRSLPEPIRNGDIKRVLELVNLSREEDKLLFLCSLVVALIPDIPAPALILHGPQGAAKTTFLKVFKRLVDPSAAPVIGSVKSIDEFAVVAAQHRVLFFDNLTSLPAWLSDALCRAVTGDGFMKRTLYTDAETTTLAYQRLVGLSGINNVVDKPDLLDRSLILQLAPITPEQRREEGEYRQQFEELAPAIFGGMLDVLAKTLEIAPTIKLTSRPRMADFARWGAAAAVVTGVTIESFFLAYGGNVGRQNEAAFEASPVAQAVLEFMENRTSWDGRPGDLLEQLTLAAEALHLDQHDRQWPKNPQWLHRRLTEVEANLLAQGIQVTWSRTGERRTVRIEKVGENSVTGVTDDNILKINELSMTPCAAELFDDVTDSVTTTFYKENTSDDSDDNDATATSAGVTPFTVMADDDDECEAREERAAIMEFDGGLPAEDAERLVTSGDSHPQIGDLYAKEQ